MPPREPAWWYGDNAGDSLPARSLAPVGRLVGAIAEARYRRGQPYRSRLPVICVGNFTVGGTGKTPLALFLLEQLKGAGERPACLTRGYGGRRAGVAWVDPARDTAREVGDEPLLLARAAPTLVARDRRAGAEAIEREEGAHTIIVMDDGMQNPSLAKSLVIALVDGRRGLGNGRIMPAGPLRAPLEFQFGLVDCIVVNEPAARGRDGDGAAPGGVLDALRRDFPGPVLAAHTEPTGEIDWLTEQPVIAYAGIGNPSRFFDMLAGLGANVVGRVDLGDHHVFSEVDAVRLLERAREAGAALVTTEKDLVRLAGATGSSATGACAELAARSRAVPIRLVLDERDRGRLAALVDAAIKSANSDQRAT